MIAFTECQILIWPFFWLNLPYKSIFRHFLFALGIPYLYQYECLNQHHQGYDARRPARRTGNL